MTEGNQTREFNYVAGLIKNGLIKNLKNFLSKLIGERKGGIMFALGLVAICIVFGAVGQLMMKGGMSQVGEIGGIGKLLNPSVILSMFTNPYVLGGLLIYAIAAFLWLGALSSLNVSFMYPLLSLGYVLAAILGLLFLKEDITLLRWGGIVVVVIGCFLILRT